VICFEISYDDLVHDVVDGGAEILVVQTNNATFGGTAQPEQQFAISRLRAIETGRTVLVAATNGISGVIAPDGTVLQRTAMRTQDVLVASVERRTDRTMASRLGSWPEWVLAALGLGAVVATLLRRRRRPADG
jgi:apolipoprotein N-acyltransferase